MKDKPKIVLFDLETLPNLSEVMRVLPQIGLWPGRTLKSDLNSIICFGYKIYGDKKTKCKNAWDFTGWKKDVNDDYEICKFAYELLKDAAAVVTHNGVSFDWRVLQTRLYIHGLPTLPKILHIDTKLLSRRHLFLFDNRLNTVARSSKVQKLENGGWELWEKVLNRDPKSMKLMTKYCKQDVNVLEAVFKKLMPFIANMPNYNLFRRDAVECCPNCGGFNIKKQGQKITKTRVMQRLQCGDCGTWSSEEKKFPKVL